MTQAVEVVTRQQQAVTSTSVQPQTVLQNAKTEVTIAQVTTAGYVPVDKIHIIYQVYIYVTEHIERYQLLED